MPERKVNPKRMYDYFFEFGAKSDLKIKKRLQNEANLNIW